MKPVFDKLEGRQLCNADVDVALPTEWIPPSDDFVPPPPVFRMFPELVAPLPPVDIPQLFDIPAAPEPSTMLVRPFVPPDLPIMLNYRYFIDKYSLWHLGEPEGEDRFR